MDTDDLRVLAIDQSITGTGVAMYLEGEFVVMLLKAKGEEGSGCPVCGKKVSYPKSKSHVRSRYHQEALRKKGDLSEDNKISSIERTRKILAVSEKIRELCQERSFNYAVMEGLSFGSRGQSIFDLGGLSHLIRAIFIDRGIRFVVIPPSVAKKFWCGNGNASKEEMVEETKRRKVEIPFDYDHNCNDAFVFLILMLELLRGDLPENISDKIEKSWDGE